MFIWDLIRDFLVQYIFGGYNSQGVSYSCSVGFDAQEGTSFGTEYTLVPLTFQSDDGLTLHLCIGDWLSTTTTIIIMCLIVVLFCLLVRWIFKTVTSAFLLR